MKALQEKQQEQHRLRAILNADTKEYGDISIEDRVNRVKHLQYEKHEALFAVSYTDVHHSAAENSLAGVKHFLAYHSRRDKKKGLKSYRILEEYSKTGMTPLHYAAEKGACDVVNFILDEGGDVNILSIEGNTAIMYAMKNNHLPMIDLLIKRQGNVNLVNKCGMNGFHFASQCNHHKAIEMAVIAYQSLTNAATTTTTNTTAREGDDSSEAFSGINSGRGVSNDLLFQAINQPSNNLQTPLHLACSSGSDQCVELLLRLGANPNSQDSVQETPLHKAARNSYFHLYRLLMQFGSRDDIKNVFRETPADCLVDSPTY